MDLDYVLLKLLFIIKKLVAELAFINFVGMHHFFVFDRFF